MEGGPFEEGGPPEGQQKLCTRARSQSPQLRSQRSVKFHEGRTDCKSSGSVSRSQSASLLPAESTAAAAGTVDCSSSGTAAYAHVSSEKEGSTVSNSSCTTVEGDASLLRRSTSRIQRVGSRVHSCENRPNAKALNAAVKTLESSAFIKKPSKVAETNAPAPSDAPCKDLSGFYQKLLGEDWEEQLQQISSQEVEDVFARDTASRRNSADMAGLNIPTVGENYQGKFRQRIRRRDANSNQDISDQVADDLQVADDEPLISADEIAEIRENAWRPAGEAIPPLNTLGLGYHQAWDVGKRGCLAAKLDVIWTPSLASNRLRFFVMDGTDPESFLTYYSKSDLQAARGLSSEKLGSISAWDLRDGHWTYPKAKVFIRRSDKHNRDCILENFAADFYDAMLVCLWEMETQSKIEQLKSQRRQERTKGRLSVSGPPAGVGAGGRVSAAVVSYKGTVHTHHAQGKVTCPQECTKGPRRPRDSIMMNLTRALRDLGEADKLPHWVEERVQKQREKKRAADCSSHLAPNGVPHRTDMRPDIQSPPKTAAATAASAAGQAAKKQPQGRRQSDALRMTRRPPGVPLNSFVPETPLLSPQMSPRRVEMRPQAMFG